MTPRPDIYAANTYGNYGKTDVTASMIQTTLSQQSKWGTTYQVADGVNDYTGSRGGCSGISVGTHGSAVIHLQNGGIVKAIELEDAGIQELSVKQITAASSAVITVYKRSTQANRSNKNE